jgi:hypothetical protein
MGGVGIDAEAEVGDLDLPERQKLEIARAASRPQRHGKIATHCKVTKSK